ncbi:MAG: DJ-1 family glyoxalase III [Atopobiaceae bacterium]
MFKQTTNRRVAAFLADGCEEVEALAVLDVLYRSGVPCDTVSITSKRDIVSSHEIHVTCDKTIDQLNFDDYDVLFLPGGMPGTTNLAAREPLVSQVDRFAAGAGIVAAICAAPGVVLARRGLLKGRRATANPNFQHEITENGGTLVADQPVVRDGNIFTSQGMGTAIYLGLELVSELVSPQAAEDVKPRIVFWG